MSLIREFERHLETIFEGFFARQFRSGLQPIEIAKKLAREMDANRTISVNRVYAPNDYFVQVSQADAEKFFAFKDKLCTELSDFLNSHAQRENYALMGYPNVTVEVDDELKLGELKIASSLVERHDTPRVKAAAETVTPQPPRREVPADGTIVMPAIKPKARLVILNTDREFTLNARTTIGRAPENDIVLPDQSISRRHAEVVVENDVYTLRDLGSRNGTFLNGERIEAERLSDGDELRIGMTTLVFRSGFGV